ncbi:MAG: hypothetical protein ACPL5F_14720 [Moorellaceae bacterium]
MRQVRQERTFKRDLGILLRHRAYGFDCPAVDLDWVLEFDSGEPCALIEFKHERANLKNTSKSTYHALGRLGDRAGLPAFVVVYAGDYSTFIVAPLNTIAKKVFPKPRKLTETEYVTFLYALRKRRPPVEVLRRLAS